jgi:MFS family permease
LQAVGAAMLQANSVAIIVLAVPGKSRGKAIGIQGAAQAVGLAVGPTAGGLLLAAGGWRLIFLVNVPFGFLGTAGALALVRRSRHLQERTGFDWTGLGLFFPAVVALLSAFSFGNTAGWTSPVILFLFLAALVLGAAFVLREQACAEPMIDLALFSNRRFVGITSGMLSYLVLFGVLFLVPFYLDRGLRLGSGRAGLELMAMPLALGIAAPFAGRAADRFGARPLTAGGDAAGRRRSRSAGIHPAAGSGVRAPAGRDRRRAGLLHAAQQRGDHGIGTPPAGRRGLGRAEHDQGHRDRSWPGRDRPAIRRRRRSVGESCGGEPCVLSGCPLPRRHRCGRRGTCRAREDTTAGRSCRILSAVIAVVDRRRPMPGT